MSDAAYRHQLGPSGIALDQLRAQPAGLRKPVEDPSRQARGERRQGKSPRLRDAVAESGILVRDLP